ncbi:putative membrane protein [Luteibacter sp. Sphag1AF]|uniref:DUF2069 domain-containing protein n=1 Tax=Luteibacter sp. Sphag1AF TaxID=2587031 RepID=UPI00160D4947|nr:DUF2069 domain-containing protein [Luteibacter sp. Sphag1AF]MBB3225506.1 putative membrane protein [Luteibacter sp. Sphag1AF]
MTSTLTRTQRVGLLAWAALLLVQVVWYAWLYPPVTVSPALVLAVTVIPLLLPLLALPNVTRALLWVGTLALFYFCHGVSETWSSPHDRWLAITEVVVTLLLIGTLGAGVQRRR